MTDTWRTEDIPAYQFDGSGRRPMTDYDAAMSAPNVLVKDTTEASARTALIVHLTRSREYARKYGEASWYDAAIEHILSGGTMVQVGGRGYRIRDTEICEVSGGGMPHTTYQNCPNCLPKRYPIHTWSK